MPKSSTPKRPRAVKKPRGEKVRPYRIPDCKRFTGYKPCFPGTTCYLECVDPEPIGKRILIINLDAMGNVLVTTSILPALKEKYPNSRIWWITLKNAVRLLENNPYLDRVFTWDPESWLFLGQLEFDIVMNVDKSQRSGALLNGLRSRKRLGFGINRTGVIVPVNTEAEENYILGLDDHRKFHVNSKTVGQLLSEQFRLPYRRDEYILQLTPEEVGYCEMYRERWGLPSGDPQSRDLVVGFNTGCSELYPNKKLTVDQHVTLIERLATEPGVRVLLVGGPEDTMRNAEIVRQVGEKVHSTPTEEGVRRGLCYLDLCDVIVSGDSFGMHAAIGLKKHVIVWFGVTSPREIELYDRGLKLIPKDLHCHPCWKRECPYNLECIQMVDLDAVVREVRRVRDSRRGGELSGSTT